MADHLGIDVETLRKGNHLIGDFRTYVDLHTMAHVEHLIHLLPVCARTLVDGLEQRRNGEHIVFNDTTIVADEM